MTPNLPKQPPEAIAEDVLKIAVGIAACIPARVRDDNRDMAAVVIGRAIMADRLTQRERYAKLADLHDFRPLAKLIRAGA